MEKPNILFNELLRRHAWIDGTIDHTSAINAMDEHQKAWDAYAESQYFQGKLDAIDVIKNIVDSLIVKP